MTDRIFIYKSSQGPLTLMTDQSNVIPRVHDRVELVDKRYKSRDDSGLRLFVVASVTHEPMKDRVRIEVDYLGIP